MRIDFVSMIKNSARDPYPTLNIMEMGISDRVNGGENVWFNLHKADLSGATPSYPFSKRVGGRVDDKGRRLYVNEGWDPELGSPRGTMRDRDGFLCYDPDSVIVTGA
jgi:hypothetical protein